MTSAVCKFCDFRLQCKPHCLRYLHCCSGSPYKMSYYIINKMRPLAKRGRLFRICSTQLLLYERIISYYILVTGWLANRFNSPPNDFFCVRIGLLLFMYLLTKLLIIFWQMQLNRVLMSSISFGCLLKQQQQRRRPRWPGAALRRMCVCFCHANLWNIFFRNRFVDRSNFHQKYLRPLATQLLFFHPSLAFRLNLNLYRWLL